MLFSMAPIIPFRAAIFAVVPPELPAPPTLPNAPNPVEPSLLSSDKLLVASLLLLLPPKSWVGGPCAAPISLVASSGTSIGPVLLLSFPKAEAIEFSGVAGGGAGAG